MHGHFIVVSIILTIDLKGSIKRLSQSPADCHKLIADEFYPYSFYLSSTTICSMLQSFHWSRFHYHVFLLALPFIRYFCIYIASMYSVLLLIPTQAFSVLRHRFNTLLSEFTSPEKLERGAEMRKRPFCLHLREQGE